MAGIALLAAYLGLGLLAAEGLFCGRGRMTRAWLGLTAGLVMMMWLPSLWAFGMRFTRAANLAALATAAAISVVLFLLGKIAPVRRKKEAEPPLRLVLSLVLPAAALFAFLQYTHYFRPENGALWVGQSTYGDICMHSAIITSLQNAAYPPEYSILPGHILGYPFLADALSASMLLFGTPLRMTMTIPGALMGALVFWGFLLFAWKMTANRNAVWVAFLLLFLNGGLGFLYAFDLVGEDASAVRDIFTGYYLAPANMPALNLRWVNIVCDMLLPQRTFLAGCLVLIPALWLLLDAMRGGSFRDWTVLGVWAGAMPMIHTHSFLALGMISVGALTVTAIREKRWTALRGFFLYGVLAVAIALPQLMTWTFPQTGAAGSIALRPGWVNRESGYLRDETVWFWVKNMGLPALIVIPAAFTGKREERAMAVGAALAFLVANLVRFQSLLYDNNKIMYAAYIVACPLLGQYLMRIWDRLRGVPGRAWLAVCFLTVSLVSGALSLAREVVSNYCLFNAAEVRAADYLRDETPEHCVVLAGQQHNNLAAVLAGKDLVCGAGNFLSTHGMSYSQQAEDRCAMLERPEESAALFAQYNVAYILVSSCERGDFTVNEEWFAANCPLVFSDGSVTIYHYLGASGG